MPNNMDIVAGMLIGTSPVTLLTLIASHKLVTRGKIRGPVFLFLFVVISGAYALAVSFELLATPGSSVHEFNVTSTYFSGAAVPLALGLTFGITTGLVRRMFASLAKNRELTGDKSSVA